MSEFVQTPAWTEALVQSLPEGILTLDASGQVLFLNHTAERITGWRMSEACGSSINQILPLGAGKGQILERLHSGTPLPPINALNRKGQDVTLAITAADLDVPAGFPPQRLLVIRDVTVEDADRRLRSYFLANVSHEFRTPLSALKASVELLLDGVGTFTTAEMLELIRSIHFSVTSLQTLVDNLLESVSIEAGRFRIRPRPTDVALLVAEASALMNPLLERRNQKLIATIPENLPKLSVDPMRLTQVLVNLLSNASKYGPADEPIELAIEPGKDAVKISVSDHGSGIPSDEKEYVFHRFIRLGDKDSTQYGIGLGLSVVKTIIESHGGAVGLEPRPGGGSIFWFTIPHKGAGS
ncbi:MAG TPA: ATP-binding protein [Anaerolineales bacterium]